MRNPNFETKRRDLLKGITAVAAGSMLPASGFLGLCESAPAQAAAAGNAGIDPILEARPVIGTGWHGHMFPGAVAPFGMVQLSPDTAGAPEARWNGKWDVYGWDHCSGYHYPDNVIVGFSHTHLQGTGASDLGDVLLMPLAKGRNWSWSKGVPGQQAEAQIEAVGANSGWVLEKSESGYPSFFSHEHEVARPGYYAVNLDTPEIRAELTATTRCGMHRYSYSNASGDGDRGLLLDLIHGIGCEVYEASLTVESPTRVSGHRATHGWAADKTVYFVIEFSRPAAAIEVKVDGAAKPASVGARFSGKSIQAIFTDGPGAGPLTVRVGISATGIDGARKNLAAEIPHWDFDRVARQSEAEWRKALSVIEARTSDAAMRQTFYSGCYHGLVAPSVFNDVDGSYRGQDHRNYPNPGFTKYTTLSIWDIYRGEFVYMMLTQPHRTGDVIRTLLADYDQLGQHSLPVWPLWGNETWCMTGFHVVGMIAGAYARGLRDFDAETAYAAMRDTALTGATLNGNKDLQEQFRKFGYVPTGKQKQSVSRTLDFAYDYWCVGAMADMLGKKEDAAMFYKLGQNYRNIFDAKTGFMRGKAEDGRFREPFRPDQEYWEDYTESDGWQATFNVMQDVQGLIDLYGGDAAFIAKLDALFAASSNVYDSPPDITGMIGQDAQGNEPSNHIPYLYSFAGAPWRTQQAVRRVAQIYRNTPAGIPGNDDCGQISTWYVLAALGFYPVNAVTGVYVIGSPLVDRARIRNPLNGRTFSIVAENNSPQNMYIQRAELNGKELTRSWFTHADIANGGELVLRMTNRPNKDWGAARADRPPSALPYRG
ncbi:MAG: GH92 family glycosyl hydrolase [Acidobacteriota bacterium]